MGKTLACIIAQTVQARLACIESGNAEWQSRHTAMLTALARAYLPSGAGIDSGTEIDLDRSTADRLVFTVPFHHMTNGFYNGWTNHAVYTTPTFDGLAIIVRARGQGRAGINDYLADVFRDALTRTIPAVEITALALRTE